MPYQIDQSGKIEHGHGPTVVALADGKLYTVLISAQEKRAAVAALARIRERKVTTFFLFAALLYYLLRELPTGATVTIDTEYTGHEEQIKAILLPWLREERADILAEHIVFGYVGEKSHSHVAALAVHKWKIKPGIIVKADDLLKRIVSR